jgi:hypothetical protein
VDQSLAGVEVRPAVVDDLGGGGDAAHRLVDVMYIAGGALVDSASGNLSDPEADLCLADPGFDTDLCVATDVPTFTRVYLGHVSLAEALGDGSVTLVGRSDLRRAFSGWIGLSPFASSRA